MEMETGVMRPWSRVHQRLLEPPEARRGCGLDSLLEPLEGGQPWWYLDFTLLGSRPAGKQISMESTTLCHFIMSVLRKPIDLGSGKVLLEITQPVSEKYERWSTAVGFLVFPFQILLHQYYTRGLLSTDSGDRRIASWLKLRLQLPHYSESSLAWEMRVRKERYYLSQPPAFWVML